MSLVKHAERELKLAGLFDKDSDYEGELGKAVMELVEVFSKQDHSGASASRVISIFKEVASYKNLVPLQGDDKEWNEVSDDLLQNNRVSGVFKDKKSGRAYYIDAIVWRTQTGSTWGGKTKDGISSRQNIKSFPFTPKTFYIDVIAKEVNPDDWEFTIKDKKQLKEVKKYYLLTPKGEV